MNDTNGKSNLSLYWLGILTLVLGMWHLSLASAEPQDLNIFAKLSKQVVPSVVNLSVVNKVQTRLNSPMGQPFSGNNFQYFFNGQMPTQKEVSLGTGFIIDASGILLTNNHVVAHSDTVAMKNQFREK